MEKQMKKTFNIIFIDFPSNLTKIGLLICFYGKPLTSDADLTKKARLLVLTSDPDLTKKPDGWCNNNITRQFHLFMNYDREYIMNNIC